MGSHMMVPIYFIWVICAVAFLTMAGARLQTLSLLSACHPAHGPCATGHACARVAAPLRHVGKALPRWRKVPSAAAAGCTLPSGMSAASRQLPSRRSSGIAVSEEQRTDMSAVSQ